ncbi:MAG: hypothetical protein ACLQVJ_04115, partial [Syntrophobacteraceae bacterium]
SGWAAHEGSQMERIWKVDRWPCEVNYEERSVNFRGSELATPLFFWLKPTIYALFKNNWGMPV